MVCNHVSYLDSILMVSLFPRHKTIVKSAIFRYPVFGWFLKQSGYIPSDAGQGFDGLILRQVERMPDFLSKGGNVFIFPEGTRSLDGRLGAFNIGAFKLARRCSAPIRVLMIRNTDRLFQPRRFWFNTCVDNVITLLHVGEIAPDSAGGRVKASVLMERARGMMENF